MDTIVTLSESAVATLRLRMRGHRLPTNEQRLPAYRELAEAGIMEPVGGVEAEFRPPGILDERSPVDLE